MTIAAVHISPEGVVLGTDSTSTVSGPNGNHFHDYEQKLFEVGPTNSKVGLATWGMGQIGDKSHRTIAAELGEKHKSDPFASMLEIAQYLASQIGAEVAAAGGQPYINAVDLRKRASQDPKSLSPEEWGILQAAVNRWSGGYFLAGRVVEAVACEAYEVAWSVLTDTPQVTPLMREMPHFRGVPHIMQRLVLGYDEELPSRILQSGKWDGTGQDLLAILGQSNFKVRPELLPLRDAIDWIHTVIHTTIRANKFSGWHYCGGPVEVAVITSDRPFRWVCHKGLDAAIITAQEGIRR